MARNFDVYSGKTELFKIYGSTTLTTSIDYTKNILVPTYNVNEEVEYKEFRDSLGIYHRYPTDYYDSNVSGEFDMYFDRIEDLNTFVIMVNNWKRKSDNKVYMLLYVNNRDRVVTDWFFITIEFKDDAPYMSKNHDPITIKVER